MQRTDVQRSKWDNSSFLKEFENSINKKLLYPTNEKKNTFFNITSLQKLVCIKSVGFFFSEDKYFPTVWKSISMGNEFVC